MNLIHTYTDVYPFIYIFIYICIYISDIPEQYYVCTLGYLTRPREDLSHACIGDMP